MTRCALRSVWIAAASLVLWLGPGSGMALGQEERPPYIVAPVDPPGISLRSEPRADAAVTAVLPAGTLVWVAGPEGQVDGVWWRWVRDEAGQVGLVQVNALVPTDPSAEPATGPGPPPEVMIPGPPPEAIGPGPAIEVVPPDASARPAGPPAGEVGSGPDGPALRVANTEGGGVTVRSEPGGASLGVWPEGATVLLLGEQHDDGTRVWEKVRGPDGQVGWVASEFLLPSI